MNLLTFRSFGLAFGLLSLLSLAAQAEVPDPSFVVNVYPQVLKAGPPPIIKPGTRLTYFGGSSTINGVRAKLVPDENGNWVDKVSGRRYAESDVRNTGGVGYSIARVGHVDREVAVVHSATYLLDPLAKTVTSTGATGIVTNAGAAGDYWIHPAVLKDIQEVNANGQFIGRMPYVVMNRKFNAIRFQNDTASGHNTYVYDLDSGLMIFHGSSLIGGDVITPGVNGNAGVGRGSTFLSHGFLMEVKDIEVPWKNSPTPAWVGQFRELKYDGGITTAIQGVPPHTQAVSVLLTPKARENGWLRYNNTTTIAVYGLPPQQSQSNSASGHASVGGLWIPPQGLAALKAGQVIETNDIIKTKTAVTDIGRGYVTISEMGQIHRLDVSYDTTSGIMAGVTLRQQNQIAVTTTQLRLSGQR